VDFAEKHHQIVWEVNVGGTKNIVKGCQEIGAHLVFVSSNAVFDGHNPPYAENAPLHPINVYGTLKAEAEQVVSTAHISWSIVRPILIYGWPGPDQRGNMATWVIEMLSQKKSIAVVDDVFSMPLLDRSCAESIWAVIGGAKKGFYHVAGADRVTLYEFARTVAETFELNAELVRPVPSSYFPDIAPRPRDTSFRLDRIRHELGLEPVGLKAGLREMRSQSPEVRG
jgi:dTDP-4-dehydrorhamnose reductase